jgi:ABC-type phosphate transport system substrate-binding protein
MSNPTRVRRMALAVGGVVLMASVGLAVPSGPAHAASPPADTVLGEGGGALVPVMDKLLHDDGAALSPEFGSYTDVDNDAAIADFVGTAPNTFGADFAVTERKLTDAEAAKAKANGRSFAYVPFAAAPVAVVTLVPNNTYSGSPIINSTQYCQHIPLTLTQLSDIFGFDASSPLLNWGDARIQCSTPGTTADAVPISLWANLDPTMENFQMMSYLDSTPASKATFLAGLQNAQTGGTALTVDPTPSEVWPYSKPTIPGGDESLLGKVVAINSQTNAPSTQASLLALGAAVPVSADWTGAPLGVTWDLPTAAIQNDQGSFVAPTAAAATASEADATLAATADPTTNNLVTFNSSTTDAAAYNSALMLQSYLVVPTNGLSAAKATALAQFIRFALGGTGQKDIASLEAAPATTAMVSAGLKVAQQLNVEAAADPAVSAATPAPTAGTPAATSNGTGGTGSGGGGAGSGSALAFTGSNPLPLAGLGVALLVLGEGARRLVRRRAAR